MRRPTPCLRPHAEPPAAGVPGERLRAGTADYRRAGLALFIGGFFTFVLLYNLQPLMPALAAEFALTPALASGALSAATLALAFALIPAAMLADCLGRKPLMVASLTLASVLTLAAAFAPDYTALLFLRALLGLALAGLPAVAMTYLSEEVEGTALGRAMGLYISGNALGGMSGRFLAALITDMAGWRTALALLALASALAAVAFWRLLPPSRHFHPTRVPLRQVWAHARQNFADPGLPWLVVLAFLLMGCFTSLYNYLGFRLAEAPFSLGTSAIGGVFLLYLVGISGSSLAPRLAERHGRPATLNGMIAIMGVGLALTLAWWLPAVIAGVGLFTLGFFGGHAVAAGWVGRRPVAARALAAALYLCAYYLGSSVFGSLSGLAWAFDGWPGVAACLAAALMLSALIVGRLKRPALAD